MAENVSGTAGHELEAINVQDLKAAMKKGGNISIYNDCICSTAAATAAKVTNTVPPSFSLTNKAKILVEFTYGINVANATLQVGENAAKPIYYRGAALAAGLVQPKDTLLLKYNGTQFDIIGELANAYTKAEVDQKFDEFAGPTYDEVDHGFNFPSTSKMTYDAVDHGFVFG